MRLVVVSILAAFAVLASLVFPAIYAQAAEISQYSLLFDIQSSGEVIESLDVAFAQETGEAYYNFMFAGDIFDLRITDGQKDLEYTIENVGNEYIVRLLVPSGTRELHMGFSSSDMVYRNGNVLQFFTGFQPPAGLERAEIKVILPQGFSIYRDMCSPENPLKTTDGNRISLGWSIQSPGENVPISVKFYNPYRAEDSLILPAIGILFAAILAGIFLRYRKKSGQAFLRGFAEDEAKVVQALKSKRVCYQNRLVKELGFSKAKMSRITQKLERRGLIARERMGKNKRIEWKG